MSYLDHDWIITLEAPLGGDSFDLTGLATVPEPLGRKREALVRQGVVCFIFNELEHGLVRGLYYRWGQER